MGSQQVAAQILWVGTQRGGEGCSAMAELAFRVGRVSEPTDKQGWDAVEGWLKKQWALIREGVSVCGMTAMMKDQRLLEVDAMAAHDGDVLRQRLECWRQEAVKDM